MSSATRIAAATDPGAPGKPRLCLLGDMDASVGSGTVE